MSLRSIPANTKQALDILNDRFINILNEFEFYLAGGTALALQIDHRVSYDLDFFTSKEFEPSRLLDLLKGLQAENVQTSFGILKLTLNGTLVSFFYYPYKILEKSITLENYNVKICNKLDIGLMKITALADRGLKKDFVDLYFIARELAGLKVILNSFEEKFPNANYYHYPKSLTYFETADQDPNLNMLVNIDWEEVKKYFVNQSKKLVY